MPTCSTCGSVCDGPWCAFCERALGGCAFGQCTDPHCYICVEMQAKFRVERCTALVDGVPCRKVRGHYGYCQPMPKTRARDAKDGDKRDGAPAIAGRRPKEA